MESSSRDTTNTREENQLETLLPFFSSLVPQIHILHPPPQPPWGYEYLLSSPHGVCRSLPARRVLQPGLPPPPPLPGSARLMADRRRLNALPCLSREQTCVREALFDVSTRPLQAPDLLPVITISEPTCEEMRAKLWVSASF